MYYEKGHFYSKSNWLFNFRVMVVNKMCLQLPKSKQSISKKEIIYFFEQFGLISEELENWSSLKGLFTFWTLYVYIHILSKEKQSEKDEIFKVEKSNEKRFFHSNGYFILSQIEVGHISTWMKWYKANKRVQILT